MKSFLNRREFLSAAAGSAVLSVLSPNLSLGQTANRRNMNVLFIAVDDLRPQLGCYGHKQILSPNIDRLAREGLLFERTYCQQAVCGATRASLLVGARPDTTGVHGNSIPVRKAMPDVVTLPEHFKLNGYETLSIGKIYHHPSDDAQGWTAPPYRAGTFAEGPWQGRGYLTEEAIAQMEEYNKANPKMQGRGPAFEAADVPDSAYPDGNNADYAIRQLRRLKNKPFFLAMGFYKPHLPFNAPKKYWDLYRREDIRLADNPFVPKDAPSYATTNWGELRNYCGIPKQGPCPDELARQLIHGYYACVSYTDAMIGRLLDELDRLGLRDNTAIVLWGDHGWKLGEHAGWCKHTNFELDTHVPMILSVPGMKTGGQRTQALTEFVDIYPTLCQACGLSLPKHLEGVSAMPLLADPSRPWKKAAFSQYPRGKVTGYSMRTERFRYTEWQNRKTGEVLARELYDHDRDPHENVNAAGQPEYRADVERLSQMLKAGWRAARPSPST
ncbi:MAG: sulfatase [Sedimentisphaerales bacterium]|nr:sulfatase [Sedimentisphaerales bacterium]